MTLTKQDLVLRMADKAEYSAALAHKAVEIIIKTIKRRLAQAEAVKIKGIGTWFIRSKQGRQGRNPKTGEEIKITARKIVVFHTAPTLRKLIQERYENAQK